VSAETVTERISRYTMAGARRDAAGRFCHVEGGELRRRLARAKELEYSDDPAVAARAARDRFHRRVGVPH
jgi:hypothetical protein